MKNILNAKLLEFADTYIAHKRKFEPDHTLLLFRFGEVYEGYFEDAFIIARLLKFQLKIKARHIPTIHICSSDINCYADILCEKYRYHVILFEKPMILLEFC